VRWFNSNVICLLINCYFQRLRENPRISCFRSNLTFYYLFIIEKFTSSNIFLTFTGIYEILLSFMFFRLLNILLILINHFISPAIRIHLLPWLLRRLRSDIKIVIISVLCSKFCILSSLFYFSLLYLMFYLV
jgi:hypothetical protein